MSAAQASPSPGWTGSRHAATCNSPSRAGTFFATPVYQRLKAPPVWRLPSRWPCSLPPATVRSSAWTAWPCRTANTALAVLKCRRDEREAQRLQLDRPRRVHGKGASLGRRGRQQLHDDRDGDGRGPRMAMARDDEMGLGLGAGRLRELAGQERRHAPSQLRRRVDRRGRVFRCAGLGTLGGPALRDEPRGQPGHRRGAQPQIPSERPVASLEGAPKARHGLPQPVPSLDLDQHFSSGCSSR